MTDRNRDLPAEESQYEVLAPLASGTYGEHLVAVRRDRFGVDKLFVLRQLRRSLTNDKAARATFVDVGRRAARLSHPNVVQTFELNERGGALCAVTEYVDGEPLDAMMAAIAPAPHAVDARLWLLIACEVLNGLHYAHELKDFDGSPLGIIHGGVTPKRIFVSYAGRVVVSDFGLAALARHARRVEGTFLPDMLAYRAPEQRQGKTCDRRADIFAVGVILWELLSGRRFRYPMDLDSTLDPLPPLKEVKEGIDPKLSAAVARAVHLDPGQRWETAHEFRRSLEPHVDLALLRKGALGDSLAALFARTRGKIPSLLSRRLDALGRQDAAALALVPAAAKISEPPQDDDQEEAFLLGSPIEAVSEDAVISVRELVSESELLLHESMSGSEVEPAPESTMPISSAELLLPEDEGSGHSLVAAEREREESKEETSDPALEANGMQGPKPTSGAPTPLESSPIMTERSPKSEPASSADERDTSESAETNPEQEQAPPESQEIVKTSDSTAARDTVIAEPPRPVSSESSLDSFRPTLTDASIGEAERDVEHLGSEHNPPSKDDDPLKTSEDPADSGSEKPIS